MATQRGNLMLTRYIGMCLLVCSANAYAQPTVFPPLERIAAQPEPGAIPLYKGVAPGSEGATQPEIWGKIGTERIVRNVTRPTIEPFLPAPSTANGAAVIVAPGGAFFMLSMDNEGYPVARALADRGIAAFVLKYRLDPTPLDEREFESLARARFGGAAKAGADKVAPLKQPLATMDAQTALAFVRAHAADWHIDPHRIGLLGFSAGAMAALEATLQNAPERPDFVGLIYGPVTPVSPPKAPPPLFLALAADDPLFGQSGFGLVDAWKKAGAPVELHYYEKGGHGFGLHKQHTTSDQWFEQFVQWLSARGVLLANAKP